VASEHSKHGLSELRHAYKCKMHTGFERLSTKNAKYL
jgi:hypothetical protein